MHPVRIGAALFNDTGVVPLLTPSRRPDQQSLQDVRSLLSMPAGVFRVRPDMRGLGNDQSLIPKSVLFDLQRPCWLVGVPYRVIHAWT